MSEEGTSASAALHLEINTISAEESLDRLENRFTLFELRLSELGKGEQLLGSTAASQQQIKSLQAEVDELGKKLAATKAQFKDYKATVDGAAASTAASLSGVGRRFKVDLAEMGEGYTKLTKTIADENLKLARAGVDFSSVARGAKLSALENENSVRSLTTLVKKLEEAKAVLGATEAPESVKRAFGTPILQMIDNLDLYKAKLTELTKSLSVARATTLDPLKELRLDTVGLDSLGQAKIKLVGRIQDTFKAVQASAKVGAAEARKELSKALTFEAPSLTGVDKLTRQLNILKGAQFALGQENGGALAIEKFGKAAVDAVPEIQRLERAIAYLELRKERAVSQSLQAQALPLVQQIAVRGPEADTVSAQRLSGLFGAIDETQTAKTAEALAAANRVLKASIDSTTAALLNEARAAQIADKALGQFNARQVIKGLEFKGLDLTDLERLKLQVNTLREAKAYLDAGLRGEAVERFGQEAVDQVPRLGALEKELLKLRTEVELTKTAFRDADLNIRFDSSGLARQVAQVEQARALAKELAAQGVQTEDVRSRVVGTYGTRVATLAEDELAYQELVLRRHEEKMGGIQEEAIRENILRDKRRWERLGEQQEAANLENVLREKKLARELKAIQEQRDIEMLRERERSFARSLSYATKAPVAQVTEQIRVRRALDSGFSPESLEGNFSRESIAAAQSAGSLSVLEARHQALTSAIGKTSVATSRYTDNQWNAHAAARGLAGSLGQLWLTYGALLPLLGGAALGAGFITAAKSGSEFAYQLTFVKALGDESAESIKRLGDEALKLSKTGLFDPSEIASGTRVLAQAGLSAAEALSTLPKVLDLATVGELGLADASTTVVGVLTAFNLGISEAGRVGDVFAKAAAVSQTSVQDMTQAMRTASVVGEQYGATLEDTASALTLLAKVNIVGTAAGTSLRNMLKELYTPGKQASDTMKELGLNAADSSGKLRPFADVVFDLKGRLAEFDAQSRVNILQKLFGERGAKEAIALLALTRAEWDNLRNSIADSEGFMRGVAEQLENTTKGQFLQAFNTLKAELIETFQTTEGAMTELAKSLKNLFSSAEFKAGLEAVVTGMTALAKAALNLLPTLIKVGEAFLLFKAGEAAIVIFNGLGTAMKAAAVAQGLWTTTLVAAGATTATMTARLGALSAGSLAAAGASGVLATAIGGVSRAALVLIANPWVAVVGLAGAALAALAYNSLTTKSALEELQKASTEYITGLEKLGKTMDDNLATGEENLTQLREQIRLMREGKTAAEGFAGAQRQTLVAKTEADIAQRQSNIGVIQQSIQEQKTSAVSLFLPGGLERLKLTEAALAEQQAQLKKAQDFLSSLPGKFAAADAQKAATAQENATKDAIEKAKKLNEELRALNEARASAGKRKLDLPELDIQDASSGSTERLQAAIKVREKLLYENQKHSTNTSPPSGLVTDLAKADLEAIKNQISEIEGQYKVFVETLDLATAQGLTSPLQALQSQRAALEGYYELEKQAIEQGIAVAQANVAARIPKANQELQKWYGDSVDLALKHQKDLLQIDQKLADERQKNIDALEKAEIASGVKVVTAADTYVREFMATNGRFMADLALDIEAAAKQATEALASGNASVASQAAAELARLQANQQRYVIALDRGYRANQITDGLKTAKSSVDELTKRVGEAAANDTLFDHLIGTAQDISRIKAERLPEIQAMITTLRGQIANANLSDEKRTIAENSISEMEVKVRQAIRTTDPLVGNLSTDIGDAVAHGIVYGFQQGDTPAQVLANALQRYLYQSLSTSFTKALDFLFERLDVANAANAVNGVGFLPNFLSGGFQGLSKENAAATVAANSKSGDALDNLIAETDGFAAAVVTTQTAAGTAATSLSTVAGTVSGTAASLNVALGGLDTVITPMIGTVAANDSSFKVLNISSTGLNNEFLVLASSAKIAASSLASVASGGAADTAGKLAGLGSNLLTPIANALPGDSLDNLIKLTGGFGTVPGFANGGVMSPMGPIPLKAYASGGVATSPQMAVFGEGRMNEAFVPLPDGRNIPVKMVDNSNSSRNQNTNITINMPAGTPAETRRAAAQGAREALAAIRRAQRYG